MTTYNFISADPGAGKTQWAIRSVKKWVALQHPVLFVVPTIRLCDEIESSSNEAIKAIHSANSIETAQSRIMHEFNDYAKTHIPRAIVITDASFLNMTTRNGADNWVVIKDEPKEPITINSIRTTDSLQFIKDQCVEIHDPEDGRFLSKLEGIKDLYKFNNRDDDIFGPLAELRHYMSKPDYFEVLVDMDKLSNEDLFMYSVFQKPALYEDFAEVYFMGANFEHSFMYHNWENDGITWINKTPSRLRRMPSKRLNIHYLFDYNNGWSRAFREYKKKGVRNIDVFCAWINDTIPGNDYVYVTNNEYADEEFNLSGSRMSAEVHGLNCYRDYNKAVLFASYLSNHMHEPFYHHYKSSTTDSFAMRSIQYYVQQLTRTDIRNYDSDKPIEVFVPTQKEATALLGYFKDATIISHQDGTPDKTGKLKNDWRPEVKDVLEFPNNDFGYFGEKVYGTVSPIDFSEVDDLVTEDEFKSQGMEKALNELILADPGDSTTKTTPSDNKGPEMRLNADIAGHGKGDSYTIIQNAKTMTCGSKWKRIYFTNPLKQRFQVNSGSKHIGFIVLMSSAIDSTGMDKNQRHQIKMNNLPWISAGVFKEDTTLKKDECLGGKLIGFDFDDTLITDRQISKVMKNWEYLQYTTISHQEGSATRRIRVIAPFDRVLDMAEFDRVRRYFFDKFEEICPVNLGLDKAKSEAYAKLFVPTANSNVKWVKVKSGSKTKLVEVERILSWIPPAPKVQLPTLNDIQWTWFDQGAKTVAEDSSMAKQVKRITDVVNSMQPHDRSSKAVKVGGMLSKVPPQHKAATTSQIMAMMKSRGVDTAALKQAMIYANK